MLCLSAIFCSTGLFNTIGSASLLDAGRSGDPRGEYAVTTIPAERQKKSTIKLKFLTFDFITLSRSLTDTILKHGEKTQTNKQTGKQKEKKNKNQTNMCRDGRAGKSF